MTTKNNVLPTKPHEPTWLQLANMTDQDLAVLWQEWDHYCIDLIKFAGLEPGTAATGWKFWDEAHAIRTRLNDYAGMRLITRHLSDTL